MRLVELCLLAAAALAGAEDQQRQQQQQDQQQRLEAVDQPPAHIVYGLLVEPWLNASSRRSRQLEPDRRQLQLQPAAGRAVRQQALVTATLLSAALERGAPPVTADQLETALAEYQTTPADQRRSLLSTSLTELGEQLHGPVIQLEALLIAQQKQLLALSESVAALREQADAHGAITQFVNSVTSTVGRRVSAVEADLGRLDDRLQQLNTSVVGGSGQRQHRSEPEDNSRRRDDTGTELAREVALLRRRVAEVTSGRCSCDRLETRLARLEEQLALQQPAETRLDRLEERLTLQEYTPARLDRLEARLALQEYTPARLDRLEAQLALQESTLTRVARLEPVEVRLENDGGGEGEADTARLDLSSASTEPRGTLILYSDPDTVRPRTGRLSPETPPTGDVIEPDIITADSVVTSDGRQTTVLLGRSIQVSDR